MLSNVTEPNAASVIKLKYRVCAKWQGDTAKLVQNLNTSQLAYIYLLVTQLGGALITSVYLVSVCPFQLLNIYSNKT